MQGLPEKWVVLFLFSQFLPEYENCAGFNFSLFYLFTRIFSKSRKRYAMVE